MKNLTVAGLVVGLTAAASAAHADPKDLRGSDTLFGVVTQAINTAGLDSVLRYVGGGSGTGETGLINSTQGIAPMSRALSTSAINNLLNQGVTPVQSVIGLDAVSMWVKADSAALGIDIPTIRAIYLCQITDWADVPNSGKTGAITVYARNGASGTTDTFKTLIGGLPATTSGNANWGACVHEVEQTTDVADATSTQDGAIGFSGLSAGRPGQNRALAVAKDATSGTILPTESNIRTFSYPLSRRLFVNSVTGGRVPSDDEQALLDVMLDRDFLDPILVNNEFITCPAVADGGCP